MSSHDLLIEAIEAGSITQVKKLSSKRRFNLSRRYTEYFRTAVKFGRINILKYLMSRNVKHLDKGNYKFVYLAAQNGHAEMVSYLLSLGYKPLSYYAQDLLICINCNPINQIIDEYDLFTDENALWAAFNNGHMDTVKVLVELYIDHGYTTSCVMYMISLDNKKDTSAVLDYIDNYKNPPKFSGR